MDNEKGVSARLIFFGPLYLDPFESPFGTMSISEGSRRALASLHYATG